MRLSIRRATRWTPVTICFLLVTGSRTDYITSSDPLNRILYPMNFEPTPELHFGASSFSPMDLSKRETSIPDFTWKPTKTPKFITSKVEKHPEPILRVYPPDTIYRSGRSRDLGQSQQPEHQARSLGRRVIYYATLPDIPRAPTNVSPLDNRYVHYPMIVANQQRSYGPLKGGKDFVTKVQSSVIDVRPRGDKKNPLNSTPTFTIVEANTTPYSGGYIGPAGSPFTRVHVDYNMYGNGIGDRPNYNYIPSYYNPSSYPKNQYELLGPNFIKTHNQYTAIAPQAYYPPTPYSYGNVDRAQYQHQLAQYQQFQQHQTSPYLYGNDVNKLPAPYHNPPYPSRHTRFPSDRYPTPSPLSQYNLGPPATSSPNHSPSHQDFNDHNLNSFHQPSLGLDGPSATISSHPSGLDLSSNLGSSLDHGIDLDEHSLGGVGGIGGGGSPLKDKFLDYNSLGQKYFDFNSLTNELPPFKNDLKDSFKFDNKEPFKGPFSQVSDWLTNKPFDLSSLDFDDATGAGNRDYQVKGSAHSVVVDSQMVKQNMTTTVKDSNNTVITPFTTSNVTNNEQEERTNR